MKNEKLREIIGTICLFFGMFLAIGTVGGFENDSLSLGRAVIYMLIAYSILGIAIYTLKDIDFEDEDEYDFIDDFITEDETTTFAEDTLIVSTALKLYEDKERKRRA